MVRGVYIRGSKVYKYTEFYQASKVYKYTEYDRHPLSTMYERKKPPVHEYIVRT